MGLFKKNRMIATAAILLLALVGANASTTSQYYPLAFAAKNRGSSDQKTNILKQRRDHQVARNPDPSPGAKHSTQRLEEPGRHRNYGTEYTKPKRHHEEEEHSKPQGRQWTFGKVNRW